MYHTPGYLAQSLSSGMGGLELKNPTPPIIAPHAWKVYPLSGQAAPLRSVWWIMTLKFCCPQLFDLAAFLKCLSRQYAMPTSLWHYWQFYTYRQENGKKSGIMFTTPFRFLGKTIQLGLKVGKQIKV